MSPKVRTILYCVAGCALALAVGIDIANESYGLLTLVGLAAAWLFMAKISPAAPDAWFLAAVFFGYVIGNRGFAQLQPAPQIPILPAEAVLLVAVPALIIRAALGRTAAVRKDALNLSIIAWIVVGSLRLPGDMNEYGVIALRDFATVYYAALFFIAQEFGGEPASGGILKASFTWSFLLLIPVVAVDIAIPDFLPDHTLFRGVPLIFHKSDLIATSLGAGFFWLWTRGVQGRRWWFVPAAVSLGFTGAMASPRAGMAAVVVTTLLWLASGRWRIAAAQAGIVALGTAAVFIGTLFTGRDFKTTAPYSAFEHAVSVFDPAGTGTYINEESGDPGSNNQFRLIWWRDVIEDTVATGPVLGQGFGADLSTRFLADYNLLGDENFAARSPHSVVMTVFGRMGLLGLACWIAVSASMFVVIWKLIRLGEPDTLGLASVVTVVWVSSTVGVVLEGPMGAVPFWTALGLANAELVRRRPPSSPDETPAKRRWWQRPVAKAGALGTQSAHR